MWRLSSLLARFGEDPVAVRMALTPAVLLWRLAPSCTGPQFLWETHPRFEQGIPLHDPILWSVRPRLDAPVRPGRRGIRVGRSRANDLVIDHPTVSRQHGWFEGGAERGWLYFDAWSSNGSTCDERRVDPRRGVRLEDGARMTLGDVGLMFYAPASFEALWLRPFAETEAAAR